MIREVEVRCIECDELNGIIDVYKILRGQTIATCTRCGTLLHLIKYTKAGEVNVKVEKVFERSDSEVELELEALKYLDENIMIKYRDGTTVEEINRLIVRLIYSEGNELSPVTVEEIQKKLDEKGASIFPALLMINVIINGGTVELERREKRELH